MHMLCSTVAVHVISTQFSTLARMFCSLRNRFFKSPNACSAQTRVADNFWLYSFCEAVNLLVNLLYGTNSQEWRANAESPVYRGFFFRVKERFRLFPSFKFRKLMYITYDVLFLWVEVRFSTIVIVQRLVERRPLKYVRVIDHSGESSKSVRESRKPFHNWNNYPNVDRYWIWSDEYNLLSGKTIANSTILWNLLGKL